MSHDGKIGALDYFRMSFEERDREVFWGLREVSRAVRVWWWLQHCAAGGRGRLKRALDRRLMTRAAGRYYGRAIAWRGRRLWWSEPGEPERFNMFADGDWVEIPEPISAVEVGIESVFIAGCQSLYCLTGDPSEPERMQLAAVRRI